MGGQNVYLETSTEKEKHILYIALSRYPFRMTVIEWRRVML